MIHPKPSASPASNIASGSVEALLGSITDIIHYNLQKTRYECSLALHEQMSKLREADFRASAKTNQEMTILLARYKAKLKSLEIEIAAYPEDMRDVWTPLVNELKAKINELKKLRTGLSC